MAITSNHDGTQIMQVIVKILLEPVATIHKESHNLEPVSLTASIILYHSLFFVSTSVFCDNQLLYIEKQNKPRCAKIKLDFHAVKTKHL